MDHNDLSRLETALLAGLPVPSDISEQFLFALHQFKEGECKTLCRALGLRAPGVSSFATRRKISERDQTIKTIAEHYPGTPWEKAGVIIEKINRYPRVGDEKPLYSVLFAIGANMPRTQEGIFNILNK